MGGRFGERAASHRGFFGLQLVQASSTVELVAFWAGVERLGIGCNGGGWEMEMEE